jgi:hypothetical protein
MAPKKRPTPSVNQNTSGDKNLVIGGDVVDSVVISGDNNTVNVNRTFIQRVSNFFAGDTEQQRDMRNRRAMLELVKNMWIKGVLEKSLYDEVLIELGMEERPDEVSHPWDVQVQMPDKPNRILPSSASITQIFDEMNGAMLILGQPGSGKTTMLLELARECIIRAQQDENRPIPVIFNLSSWKDKQTIDNWLVGELNAKYNVPKRTAQNWVVNDDLQLLLDGLDEVKPEARETCVKAINTFRQLHGLTVPIAVCSRIVDYEGIKEKINLCGAIVLQPLTTEQIDCYFAGKDSSFAGLRLAINSDTNLLELARSPLMLGVMSLAYSGLSADELASRNDQSSRFHTYLLNVYIQKMFARIARTKQDAFSEKQTIGHLPWLAQKMIQQDQVVFFVEQLQPSWLNSGLQKWFYILASRLAIGSIIGFAIGQFMSMFEVMGNMGLGLLTGIAGGAITGLMIGLPLLNKSNVDPAPFAKRFLKHDIVRTSIYLMGNSLSVGMITFIMVCLFLLGTAKYNLWEMGMGFLSPLEKLFLWEILIRAFFYAIVAGLIFGILFGLRTPQTDLNQDINTTEALSWSFDFAKRGVKRGLYVGLILGLVIGLIFMPIMNSVYENSLLYLSETYPDASYVQQATETHNAIPFIIIYCIGSFSLGVLSSVIFGIAGGLIGGVRRSIVVTKRHPNEGLRLSCRNALLAAMALGLPAGSIIGAIFEQTLNGALRGGLLLGLLIALWYGGIDMINHYILRFILCLKGHVPRDYVRFLNHCVDLIFLRRVGGGYIFVHRLLMEHFAEMYLEPPTSKENKNISA